ncbi:hypothetical protein J2810_002912 [Chryseobacterium rhizosphaerae]|uniref:hypothetical protein n=1 Tax=Chryseobacterium rhizosphaerae TaxID=395937 RepID=UPI0006484249|nr:hypothetical protein [Chryseobacterium rhizosphaerae]MDR6546843.1 hypothetical protein [Chryseobacterium rhizosphaerae]
MVKPKTFLLMMPDYSDFPNLFLKNLEQEGFVPFLITDNPSKFKYKGNEKIVNFFQKTFFKNKDYKKKLVEEHKLKEYYRKIDEIEGKLDYSLVIRPDQFPISVIKELKKKTNKLIAYQWDGIEKFPKVKDYFSLFDTFFCFDSEDEKNKIKPITNFYFDCIPPIYREFNHQKPQLYFVGLYWKNREEKIDRFIEKLSDKNVELNIFIQYYHKNEIKNPKIKYLKNRITFLENLRNVEKADVLLDFVDPVHNGLSIRFFEGMYYKKKVITDNIMVRNYDFYHPNNIFVLESDNYEKIDDFLKIPYQEISEEIVEKYGFSRWIKEIIKY